MAYDWIAADAIRELGELRRRVREFADRVDGACPCAAGWKDACGGCQYAMREDPAGIHGDDSCNWEGHALAAEMRKEAGK